MHNILIALALGAAAPALAQHPAHAPHAASSAAAPSSYAGQESREIKALSAQEQAAWLEGQGHGLAKAAELNGYPGPMHVLEHASALGLSAVQREKTQALMDSHKAEVRELGAELVAAERTLDTLFRSRQATASAVDRQTRLIASLQGRIRGSHLKTHVEQTALLQPDQIAAYDRLRGYQR